MINLDKPWAGEISLNEAELANKKLAASWSTVSCHPKGRGCDNILTLCRTDLAEPVRVE